MIVLPQSGPAGVVLAHGAGFRQQVVMGRPPLPGGVATVLRFFFNLPQWIQVGGAVVGAAAAFGVLVLLWRSRHEIVTWLLTRSARVQLGLAVCVGVLGLVGAAFGGVSYHYVEHDNAFCTGCHIMNDPFRRFSGSKHDSLECHDCHQQSMYANARQLYLWVAERPQEIGPHAKVPTRVCASCHERGDAKANWQRIASTAGHRTHLQSDSSALRNVQCVTCHGLEVHRFVTVDSTCGQAGCHVSVHITLAKMAEQTDLHCIMCHQFTADVPALATYDSARGTLVPGMPQCLGCHQMQLVLADFDPARDPHRGTCGDCHNPHTQASPADAAQTCASAHCHADWRSDPFHLGLNHRAVAENCTLCHAPHHARVDASDCAGCHAAVRERSAGKLRPPLPFDTTKALQRVSWRAGRSGRGPWVDLVEPDPMVGVLLPGVAPPVSAADSFPHARHRSLACITCHVSTQAHGRLTFMPPRGCEICHHQAAATSNCLSCHDPNELTPSVAVAVEVTAAHEGPWAENAEFSHQRHQTVRCIACHTTAGTLEPEAGVLTCQACHADHHAAGRDCAGCHTAAATAVAVVAAHAPPAEAHLGCGTCHARATVARLVPDRALCLTCHVGQNAHYAERECTTCHLQATPEALGEEFRGLGGPSGP